MLDLHSLLGRLACVTCYSLRHDPRFSYFVYVPRNYNSSEQPEAYDLAVLVHGTERAAESYRNRFKNFANWHNAVILAPLFPAGLFSPGELMNYAFLRFKGVAYDLVLLEMINELAQLFPLRSEKFLLHGFSAGGFFVNKFMYAHPERLAAVSIGAPGEATYPDSALPWPQGLKGMEDFLAATCPAAQPEAGAAGCTPSEAEQAEQTGQASQVNMGGQPAPPVSSARTEPQGQSGRTVQTGQLGQPSTSAPHPQLRKLRGVPIQVVAGCEDLGDRPGPDGQPNRFLRAGLLHERLRGQGLEARLDLVPGVGHDGFGVLPEVEKFFAGVLKK